MHATESIFRSEARDHALWIGALPFIAMMAIVTHIVTDQIISDQEVNSEYATIAYQLAHSSPRIEPTLIERLYALDQKVRQLIAANRALLDYDWALDLLQDINFIALEIIPTRHCAGLN